MRSWPDWTRERPVSWPAGLVDLAVLAPGEPLRFVHPVVRTAIYEDLSAAEQVDLHARAAAHLLADQRADPGAIAVHLLATGAERRPRRRHHVA